MKSMLIPGETTVDNLLSKQLNLNFDTLYKEYLENTPLTEGFMPETYVSKRY